MSGNFDTPPSIYVGNPTCFAFHHHVLSYNNTLSVQCRHCGGSPVTTAGQCGCRTTCAAQARTYKGTSGVMAAMATCKSRQCETTDARKHCEHSGASCVNDRHRNHLLVAVDRPSLQTGGPSPSHKHSNRRCSADFAWSRTRALRQHSQISRPDPPSILPTAATANRAADLTRTIEPPGVGVHKVSHQGSHYSTTAGSNDTHPQQQHSRQQQLASTTAAHYYYHCYHHR